MRLVIAVFVAHMKFILKKESIPLQNRILLHRGIHFNTALDHLPYYSVIK